MQTSASDFTCPNNLAIMGVGIHRDAEGRYCLNDCHKAAKVSATKKPSEWTRTEQAKALMHELAENCQSGNSRFGGFPPVSVIKGGDAPGTYADKERAGFLSYKHFDQRDADGHIHPRAQVVVTTRGITRLARILPDLMEEAA